jgi:hypothetical protein
LIVANYNLYSFLNPKHLTKLAAPILTVIFFIFLGQSSVGFLLAIDLPSRYVSHLINRDDKYYKDIKEILELIEEVKKSLPIVRFNIPRMKLNMVLRKVRRRYGEFSKQTLVEGTGGKVHKSTLVCLWLLGLFKPKSVIDCKCRVDQADQCKFVPSESVFAHLYRCYVNQFTD